jgi:F0F1-type ATP synthase epsilon subunit
MAIEPLGLRVITPIETIVKAEDVAWVRVTLADEGGLGIYPGHAPLLAETLAGALRYADAAGEHVVELSAGILSIQKDVVTVSIGH